ncbi:class I SAM-dependent RNA methyltransferase [Parvimonas sp.]|uniref:THUMP domain-containing class I SAM-dependent RNA methyltransferase n=1 Tax=Parvimonas sp. TaxID=1944660 RepID=UPI003459AC2C
MFIITKIIEKFHNFQFLLFFLCKFGIIIVNDRCIFVILDFYINGEIMKKITLLVRCAERILLKLDEFKVLSFEDLYQGIKKIKWEDLISVNDKFPVNANSVKSKLFSLSDIQKITKRAIVDRLKNVYGVEWFDETSDALYYIEVSILKDIATVTVDTSGEALHKRGYRKRAGDAPLKETLASAMISLSFWEPSRVFYDPFCGSGTLCIEAYMIGRNIAPGIMRNFAFENWNLLDKDALKNEKNIARALIDYDRDLKILGSDMDRHSILIARDNADILGVDDEISFFIKDMRAVDLYNEYGVVVTNPPYGERMGDMEEVERLYRDFGKKFKELDTWSVYLITSIESFERLYGRKADRKRKLFNGRIKVDFYQFYGPKPK